MGIAVLGEARFREGWERLAAQRYWFLLASLALSLRVWWIIVTPGGGGSDWLIYFFHGRAIAEGENPYTAFIGTGWDYRDNPPLDFLVFGAILSIWEDAESIRFAMAACDFITIVLLGAMWRRPLRWRLPILMFYAFHPLFVYNLSVISSDKPLLLLLFVALLLGIERGAGGAVAVGLLAAIKWYSFPFLPHWVASLRGRPGAWKQVVLAATIFLSSHIFYWPSNLVAYHLKLGRSNFQPNHGSPMTLLSHLGLYSPIVWVMLFGAAVAFLFGLQWFGRIRFMDAAALCLTAFIILPPDSGASRAALAVIVLALVTRPRLIAGTSLVVVSLIAWALFHAIVEGDRIPQWVGEYASLPYAIIVQAPVALAVTFWVIEHRRERRESNSAMNAGGEYEKPEPGQYPGP